VIPSVPEAKRAEFQRLLLCWWRYNMSEFPWRRTSDPYRILIAEILLRKTSRAQAAMVYESLIQRWPSPSDLARASEDELRDCLLPLGMENTRAKLLVELGQAVVDRFGGEIPDNLDNLMTIPGVGPYTAGAVLCLAYRQDQPMVDTNTARIIQRVFGYPSPKARPRDDRILWRLAADLIPKGRARDYNLALIDLAGATCRARKPACPVCPVRKVCVYWATRWGS
jgi:A/G-specific adenine glycosylase